MLPLVYLRLQREEEVAYASIQGAQSQPLSQPQAPPQASLAPFSKFEEKKTNEKTRKVTTVKKFFSPSSRTAPKKGTDCLTDSTKQRQFCFPFDTLKPELSQWHFSSAV